MPNYIMKKIFEITKMIFKNIVSKFIIYNKTYRLIIN